MGRRQVEQLDHARRINLQVTPHARLYRPDRVAQIDQRDGQMLRLQRTGGKLGQCRPHRAIDDRLQSRRGADHRRRSERKQCKHRQQPARA